MFFTSHFPLLPGLGVKSSSLNCDLHIALTTVEYLKAQFTLERETNQGIYRPDYLLNLETK